MSLLLLFGGGSEALPGGGVSGPFGSTVSFEFSPTTTALEDPVWVDITEDVMVVEEVSTSYGRSDEFSEFSPGRASFLLKNSDRTYDPTYAGSPYVGNLKPLRRFRIRCEYASVVYTLFTGWCRGWPQSYEVSDHLSVSRIELVDALGLVALTDLGAGGFTFDSATDGVLDVSRLGGPGEFTIELSGARVEGVLDLAAWPDALRDVDAGVSSLNATYPTGSVLSYLQQVAKSEDGALFGDTSGRIVFRGRDYRYTGTRSITSQATFSDDGSDNAYCGIEFTYDDQNLWNDIRRERADGIEQSVEDSASIEDYFRRSHSDTGLLLTTDGEALDLATGFLARNKDPHLRCPGLEVKPGRNPATIFPTVLGTQLLDRVTLERTPQGVGSQIAVEMIVDQITHRFTSKNWSTTLRVSPVDPNTESVLILDSVSQGILDTNQLAA